jgi:hypothetical protein
MSLESYLKEFNIGTRSAEQFISANVQKDLTQLMRTGVPVGMPAAQERLKNRYLGSLAFREKFSSKFMANPRSARYQGARVALQGAFGESPPIPKTGTEWLKMYGRRR